MTFWEAISLIFGGFLGFFISPVFVSVVNFVAIVTAFVWLGTSIDALSKWWAVVLRLLLLVFVIMVFITLQTYIAVNDIGVLSWEWGSA